MTIDEYKIDTEARTNDLRSLMEDHRFASLLAMISVIKDEMIYYCSDPTHAEEPYKVMHNLGSISGILSLEKQLIEISRPPQEDNDI